MRVGIVLAQDVDKERVVRKKWFDDDALLILSGQIFDENFKS